MTTYFQDPETGFDVGLEVFEEVELGMCPIKLLITMGTLTAETAAFSLDMTVPAAKALRKRLKKAIKRVEAEPDVDWDF